MVEVLCPPAIKRSSEDSNDLCDLSLSLDPDIIEEEPPLLPILELARLYLETPPGRGQEVLGVPCVVVGQEYPVYPAAVPEVVLCLSLWIFLAGAEEDVYNQVLVPDSAQVYASHLCFGTHFLKLLQKSPPILLFLLIFLLF